MAQKKSKVRRSMSSKSGGKRRLRAERRRLGGLRPRSTTRRPRSCRRPGCAGGRTSGSANQARAAHQRAERHGAAGQSAARVGLMSMGRVPSAKTVAGAAVASQSPSARAAPLRRDHVGVEVRAVLRRPLERLEVHVHQAEALREAERPLEVVEQRPGEIAAHVDALLDGRVDRAQVASGSNRSRSGSCDAAARRRRRIVEGRAVLGDVLGDVAVALA